MGDTERYFESPRDPIEPGSSFLKSRFERRLHHFLAAFLIALASGMAAWPAHAGVQFSIPSQNLADALDRFGEQSGLQVIYDQALTSAWRSPAVAGQLSPQEVIERLLRGSGLDWSFVNERTIAVKAHVRPADCASPATVRPTDGASPSITRLSLIQVNEDPRRILPNDASETAFGFNKTLLETPRSVSVISQEQTDMGSLSAVEDLARLVPGVFTTTRFGIQGSVDVRNVPGDTYFRGMKRLTLQGHGRSVLAAMDSIEVVRGPPSPVDGLGKVGGFTNVVPKSGRARAGGYLESDQGFVQTIYGSYDRREASFGIGGPIQMFGDKGGYYTYALLEDSNSYTRQVPIRQKVLQSALSIDHFIGSFRLEAGGNYQLSGTSGALLNRVTQDLIDHGRYIRGDPLADLDLNGNGRIGYLEYATASPVRGALSSGNQPLIQRWSWQRDEHGRPLPLDQFRRVPGIPQSMYDLLVERCGGSVTASPAGCPDPTGLLRAQGVGGPVPASGYVPVGFVLDPRTVGYDELDFRRAGAYEREIEAEFLVGYLDLIYDEHPDFTLKNQMFMDRMDQFKVSEQPSGGKQDVLVLADKLTATYRWRALPAWMQMNTLGSVIFRNTHARARRSGADVSSHRTDVMKDDGAMTPNTTFAHSYDNPNLYDDGFPWTSDYDTQYWEAGIGLLFDVDLFESTNLLFGGRIDGSCAKNTNAAGVFDLNVGTSARPGAFRTTADTARNFERAGSWSVSISHEIVPQVRPYVTYSRSSLVLDNNNNSIENAVIRRGHLGTGQLTEAGAKASLLDDKLFLTTSIFEQKRIDGSESDPSAVLNTDVTHTTTQGWETEIKWVPVPNALLSLYGLAQKTEFDLGTGANIMVDARALGFQDVLDAQGNVIYPAEAFLYGGRAFVTLPDGSGLYREKQGNPAIQVGFHAAYQWHNGFGGTISGNYFSSVSSGRLQLVDLPEAHVLDIGAFWESLHWRVKLDVSNVLDQRYFRARTGDTLGDTLVQAMPTRRWQLTARYSF